MYIYWYDMLGMYHIKSNPKSQMKEKRMRENIYYIKETTPNAALWIFHGISIVQN